MMRQAIHRDLDLASHGLLLVPYLGTVNFGDGDERLISYDNEEAAYLELKRHSPHDADAMFRFQADLTRYSQLIRKTLMRTPPDPASFRLRDLREFLWLAKKFWALGEAEVYEYTRFFTVSAVDFLDDYFENDLIKAAMASPGIIGTALGVESPGSAYILLHHVMGDVDGSIGAWGLARGGMGAISKAIASACQSFGGEIRMNSGVDKVLVEGGKAVGVVLDNGDEVRADIVVSNLDARRLPLRRSWTGTTCPTVFTSAKKLQDSRLLGQGQYRARRHAEVHACAGQSLHQPRWPGVYGFARNHGARLRLLEAWALVGRSVC